MIQHTKNSNDESKQSPSGYLSNRINRLAFRSRPKRVVTEYTSR